MSASVQGRRRFGRMSRPNLIRIRLASRPSRRIEFDIAIRVIPVEFEVCVGVTPRACMPRRGSAYAVKRDNRCRAPRRVSPTITACRQERWASEREDECVEEPACTEEYSCKCRPWECDWMVVEAKPTDNSNGEDNDHVYNWVPVNWSEFGNTPERIDSVP